MATESVAGLTTTRRQPNRLMHACIVLIIAMIGGCGSNKPEAESRPLRVGHLYVNGNCALDSENKLTGLCMGSGMTGCISHEPDPESPRCQIGLVVNEPSTAACSTGASKELVSRENQCFFVNR